MAIRLGDIAPDFEADTTDGKIKFHDWKKDSWAVLFSHPKDFTPVCTTELGYTAKLKDEFAKRNVKVIGLSVDPVESHVKWEKDIEETQGQAVNFPMIGDTDRRVATLYDMIHPNANDTMTVRSVFVHRSQQQGSPHHHLSRVHGSQLRRDPAGDRFATTDRQVQGGHTGQLEARRRRHHRSRSVERRRQSVVSGWLGREEALSAPGETTQVSVDLSRAQSRTRRANLSLRCRAR